MPKKILDYFLENVSHFFVLRQFKRQSVKKINLGCGLTVAHGWLNIDGSLNAFISLLPTYIIKLIYNFSGARNYLDEEQYARILKNHMFMYFNISKNLPFKESSIDYIYTSHFLEHVTELEGDRILDDMYRILKIGGKIRIVVPDLEYAISTYKTNKKDMLKKYFFLNKKSSMSNHRYMYDFGLMEEKLQKIGFEDINKCSYRASDFPESDQLDSYPNDSLFVEAAKS